MRIKRIVLIAFLLIVPSQTVEAFDFPGGDVLIADLYVDSVAALDENTAFLLSSSLRAGGRLGGPEALQSVLVLEGQVLWCRFKRHRVLTFSSTFEDPWNLKVTGDSSWLRSPMGVCFPMFLVFGSATADSLKEAEPGDMISVVFLGPGDCDTTPPMGRCAIDNVGELVAGQSLYSKYWSDPDED